MDIEKKIRYAEENLKRKLDWISRYDSRIGIVTALNIGMLGILANASGLITKWGLGEYLNFGLAGIFLFLCLFFIYRSQYPKTLSPNSSLIFFGTIAKMPFDEFENNFKAQKDEEYLHDLLCQVHINSEILVEKFIYIKLGFAMIILSLVPWILAIYYSKMYLK